MDRMACSCCARRLTDSIFIATGTGIAPMRGFVEYLFPDNGEDRSQGRKIWLVYGTRYETELYYEDYFERIAASRPNFFYRKTLSRAQESWEGARGYVQELVEQIAAEHAREWRRILRPVSGAAYNIHAYICGLNEMVVGEPRMPEETGLGEKTDHLRTLRLTPTVPAIKPRSG